MAKFNKNLIGKITSLSDEHLRSIKHRWYQESHKDINKNQFIAQAKDWFENSSINDIQGYNKFPVVDVIQGCTQFFESIILK